MSRRRTADAIQDGESEGGHRGETRCVAARVLLACFALQHRARTEVGQARAMAGEHARVNASVAAQARSHMGSSNTHVQFRHPCVYTWNTHTYTTETVYIHLRHTHKCVELENKHVLLGKHTHMCKRRTHICVHLRHANAFTWNTHVCSLGTQ